MVGANKNGAADSFPQAFNDGGNHITPLLP
jgi:hypothetical protein